MRLLHAPPELSGDDRFLYEGGFNVWLNKNHPTLEDAPAIRALWNCWRDGYENGYGRGFDTGHVQGGKDERHIPFCG